MTRGSVIGTTEIASTIKTTSKSRGQSEMRDSSQTRPRGRPSKNTISSIEDAAQTHKRPANRAISFRRTKQRRLGASEADADSDEEDEYHPNNKARRSHITPPIDGRTSRASSQAQAGGVKSRSKKRKSIEQNNHESAKGKGEERTEEEANSSEDEDDDEPMLEPMSTRSRAPMNATTFDSVTGGLKSAEPETPSHKLKQSQIKSSKSPHVTGHALKACKSNVHSQLSSTSRPAAGPRSHIKHVEPKSKDTTAAVNDASSELSSLSPIEDSDIEAPSGSNVASTQTPVNNKSLKVSAQSRVPFRSAALWTTVDPALLPQKLVIMLNNFAVAIKMDLPEFQNVRDAAWAQVISYDQDLSPNQRKLMKQFFLQFDTSIQARYDDEVAIARQAAVPAVQATDYAKVAMRLRGFGVTVPDVMDSLGLDFVKDISMLNKLELALAKLKSYASDLSQANGKFPCEFLLMSHEVHDRNNLKAWSSKTLEVFHHADATSFLMSVRNMTIEHGRLHKQSQNGATPISSAAIKGNPSLKRKRNDTDLPSFPPKDATPGADDRSLDANVDSLIAKFGREEPQKSPKKKQKVHEDRFQDLVNAASALASADAGSSKKPVPSVTRKATTSVTPQPTKVSSLAPLRASSKSATPVATAGKPSQTTRDAQPNITTEKSSQTPHGASNKETTRSQPEKSADGPRQASNVASATKTQPGKSSQTPRQASIKDSARSQPEKSAEAPLQASNSGTTSRRQPSSASQASQQAAANGTNANVQLQKSFQTPSQASKPNSAPQSDLKQGSSTLPPASYRFAAVVMPADMSSSPRPKQILPEASETTITTSPNLPSASAGPVPDAQTQEAGTVSGAQTLVSARMPLLAMLDCLPNTKCTILEGLADIPTVQKTAKKILAVVQIENMPGLVYIDLTGAQAEGTVLGSKHQREGWARLPGWGGMSCISSTKIFDVPLGINPARSEFQQALVVAAFLRVFNIHKPDAADWSSAFSELLVKNMKLPSIPVYKQPTTRFTDVKAIEARMVELEQADAILRLRQHDATRLARCLESLLEIVIGKARKDLQEANRVAEMHKSAQIFSEDLILISAEVTSKIAHLVPKYKAQLETEPEWKEQIKAAKAVAAELLHIRKQIEAEIDELDTSSATLIQSAIDREIEEGNAKIKAEMAQQNQLLRAKAEQERKRIEQERLKLEQDLAAKEAENERLAKEREEKLRADARKRLSVGRLSQRVREPSVF